MVPSCRNADARHSIPLLILPWQLQKKGFSGKCFREFYRVGSHMLELQMLTSVSFGLLPESK